MNKERREELADISELLNEALERLEEIRCNEQEAYDNIPEYLQCGPKGNSILEAITMMDSWEDRLNAIITVIDNYSSGIITADQANLTEYKRIEPAPPAQVYLASNHSITINRYNERSLVVRGNTRAISEKLKNFGAKFNGCLNGGPGWIISNRQENQFRHDFAQYI